MTRDGYFYGALALSLVIGLIGAGMNFDLNKSEWASWVQAVGSIVAILASMEIFRRQSASQAHQVEVQRIQSRMEKQITAYAVCISANEMIEELCGAYGFGGTTHSGGIANYFSAVYSPGAFDQMFAALQAIPLHELGSYQLTCGVLDIQNAIFRSDAFCNARGFGPVDILDLDPRTPAVLSAISAIGTRGFQSIEQGVALARRDFQVPR